jgi:hypothetical protein
MEQILKLRKIREVNLFALGRVGLVMTTSTKVQMPSLVSTMSIRC